VIQGNQSKIAASEEKVANSKLLMNQWRNELSSRDRLGHHLVFTKSAQEPTSFASVGSEADSPESLLKPSPAMGHAAEILDVEANHVIISFPLVGNELDLIWHNQLAEPPMLHSGGRAPSRHQGQGLQICRVTPIR
jgi:hypothetical protein